MALNLVVITADITSKLITTLELCSRLRSSGHGVTLMVPQTAAAKVAEIECILFTLKLATLRNKTQSGRKAGIITRFRRRLEDHQSRARYGKTVVAEAGVSVFQRKLATLRPDLVLIDIEAHECIMAAVQAGHRVVLINVFFNLWKRPSVPPLHVRNMPGRGIGGSRFGIEMTWWRYRLWICRQRLHARFDPGHYLAVLEAYAKRLRFPLTSECDYFQALLPFVYRRLPMLTLNLPELDLPHEPHPGSFYIGPMVNTGQSDIALNAQAAQVMAEIRRFVSAAEHTLIYCAFGSYFYGDNTGFWQQLVAVAARYPQWRFVFGLGEQMSPEALGRLPANIRAYRWVPQVRVLALADCAVIHAGMTSVYDCIYHRVPMVVYPYAEIFDQFGTATRVGFHRLGVVGDRYRDKSDEIANHIACVLTDDTIDSRLKTMQQYMQRYLDEKPVDRAIESIYARYRDDTE